VSIKKSEGAEIPAKHAMSRKQLHIEDPSKGLSNTFQYIGDGDGHNPLRKILLTNWGRFSG
jgi:hypothetical protein